MVSLRNIVAAIAFTVPVMAQTSPAQVVININVVTQLSLEIQPIARQINVADAALLLLFQGNYAQIITKFTGIVNTVTTSLNQMQGMAPVPAGPESVAIFEAFREFVRVHQALLDILIGKAGLFRLVPFIGVPVATALKGIENVVDAIAFALIDRVQSQATGLQLETNKLKGSLATSQKTYSGLITLPALPTLPLNLFPGGILARDAPISRVRRAVAFAA